MTTRQALAKITRQSIAETAPAWYVMDDDNQVWDGDKGWSERGKTFATDHDLHQAILRNIAVFTTFRRRKSRIDIDLLSDELSAYTVYGPKMTVNLVGYLASDIPQLVQTMASVTDSD